MNRPSDSLDDARAYAQKAVELHRSREGGSLAPRHPTHTSCPETGRGRDKGSRSFPSSKAKGPTSHRTQYTIAYTLLALFVALALIPAAIHVYDAARELQAAGGQN